MSVLVAVTTAGAATREPTVHTRARAPTVAARRLADTRPRPSSPTSSPRPATMATVTPRPADAMETAAAPVTRGNALAPGHALARQSRWSEIGTERGSASAPLTNSPQRNTNTSEAPATAARGGRGSAPAPTTGRGSAATRANTTAAADTRATGAIGAERRQQPSPGWSHIHVSPDLRPSPAKRFLISSWRTTPPGLACYRCGLGKRRYLQCKDGPVSM